MKTALAMPKPSADGPNKKQRLEHVDAMRPLKQFGVVLNHSIIFFAPAASLLAASSILLLHVTREAFIFISACMLTYAYPLLMKSQLKRFYWRRFLSVGVPYMCWTVIYFILSFKGTHYTLVSGLHTFGYDLLTGYYQLYFLVLLIQFYLIYPLLQKAVIGLRKHHIALVVLSLFMQIGYVSLMHWDHLPTWMENNWANRELLSYQFYIIGGMVAAYHFDAFHSWITNHVKLILIGTLASAGVGVAWVMLAGIKHIAGFGYESDPFQPIIIPFNVGAILSIYVFGVWLVRHAPQTIIRRITTSGAVNSYGIYTAQLVFLNLLLWTGFGSLAGSLPWWLVVLLATIITFCASWLLTALLARTALSQALTGRRRQSWNSLWQSTAFRLRHITSHKVQRSRTVFSALLLRSK